MDVCQARSTGVFCVCACICVGMCCRTGGWVRWTWLSWRYERMCVVPSCRSFPFMSSAWITLCNTLCQVATEEGAERTITFWDLLLLSPERRQLYFPWTYSLLHTDRRRMRPFCRGNIYLSHKFAKGHGKVLVTGHDSRPTTHSFCVLNLFISMGKFFWSPHPAVNLVIIQLCKYLKLFLSLWTRQEEFGVTVVFSFILVL